MFDGDDYDDDQVAASSNNSRNTEHSGIGQGEARLPTVQRPITSLCRVRFNQSSERKLHIYCWMYFFADT